MVGYAPCIKKCSQGFTLIEMTVVVGIVVILASLAIPSFVETIKRYHVTGIKDELEASIHLGRVEAIRRGVPIVLGRTSACGKALVDSGDWGCGWEMVIDSDANGIKTEGEQILQTYSMPANYLLNHFAGGAQSLVLNVWGQVSGVGHRFVISQVGDMSGVSTNSLCISSGGRLRTVVGSFTCSL